jgi:hypothetical protein
VARRGVKERCGGAVTSGRGWRWWPLSRCLALRLAQTLGVAGHGDITASVATRLELSEESQDVAAPRVPAFEEIGGIGREETAAAVTARLALGKSGGPQRAKHRILADAEPCRDRMPRPSLAVQGPDLLIERQPLGPPLVRELLGDARRRRRGHQDGDRAVGWRHQRLGDRLIDGLQSMVMGVEHLVEGFRRGFAASESDPRPGAPQGRPAGPRPHRLWSDPG